jgi:YopX protein
MREIKFRAWDKERNQIITDKFLIRPWDGLPMSETYMQPQLELMQFTGLKDKNGRDIYEGDILEFLRRKGDVYWDQLGLWAAHWNEDYNHRLFAFNQKDLEIIGNIYEKPDLLK